MIRVLVADGDDGLRETLAECLDAYDDIQLVGEAGDGQVARGAVEALNPDVVLLGARLTGIPGPELTAWLAAHYPAVRVLVLAGAGDEAAAVAMARAGAVAVLPGAGPAELVARAILGAVAAA